MNDYKRVYASISKEALIYNIENIRNSLNKDTLIMTVVKADAYGHNADEVTKIIDPYADFYAVAIIEEALCLRKSGVTKPIMILGYTSPCYFKQAVCNNIRVTVFTYEAAEKLSVIAKECNMTAYIHIALDTGMGRIGFQCTKEDAEIVLKITMLENIEIEGIFTHFATADEADKSFSLEQEKKFSSFNHMLKEKGVNIKIKHIANSAAIIELTQFAINMARPGIILYGLYPSDEVNKNNLMLKPVMELVSNVVFVKNIKKGDTVSYGRTFTATKDMTVATIPVGYADGYPRLLSNNGRVIINGKYAPIIGRICMDQFMVDVTDILNVKEGDEAVLMGKRGQCEISADEIAKITGTISYEVVCDIGKRVPRIII